MSEPAEPPIVARGAYVAPGLRALAHLNRGHVSDVYRVVDELDGRERVAKVLRADVTRPDAAARLRREGQLLLRLRHPNIIRALRAIESPAGHVLELLPGTTLRERLRHAACLPWPEVARLGAHLASALLAVHRAGLLHCDLKPANVFVTPDRFVLLDFDLARPPGHTSSGLGTRLYNAPEQAGGGDVGGAADTWGLGVILFRAATGRLPFEDAEGDPQVERPAPRTRVGRAGGGDLGRIIDAMLHPSPAGRPLLAWLEHELPRQELDLRRSAQNDSDKSATPAGFEPASLT